MGERVNESMTEVGELGRVLSKLSMKSIPTWDASNRNEKSIASHLKTFENVTGGLDLDNEELARELIASLRGQAQALVENLEDDERKDYAALKQLLMDVFHKEKPIQILIQEFYSMNWKKKKQTIRQYATALDLTWKKIAKNQTKDDKTSDAILKNRLMDGISAAEPKFGEWLQFTTTAEVDFKTLAVEAENKYDVFKVNRERVHEHEWEEEPSFFNKEKIKDENQIKNSKNPKNGQEHDSGNIKRDEPTQGRSNTFQDQRREQHGGGQPQQWELRPRYHNGTSNYYYQRQPNWGQPRNQSRWNSYDRRYNQYQGGVEYYPRHQNFSNNGWNRNNGGRTQPYGFQRRPFGITSNWNQGPRQSGYRNNENRYQSENRYGKQQECEDPRQSGTYVQHNQNVNFLENTSKNL